MKHKLSLFLFLVLNLNSYSQNTFFKWYPTVQNEFTYSVLEITGGNFLIGGGAGPEYYAYHQKCLLKIDPSGNVLASITSEPADTTTFYVCLFNLPGEGNGFGAAVDYIYSNNGHNYINYSLDKYSGDFELISKKTFTFPADYGLFPQYSLGVNDSLFLIQFNEITYLPYYHNIGSVVSKYNYQFDNLASYTETTSDITAFGMLKNPQNNTIKAFNCKSSISTTVSEINMDMQFLKKSNLSRIITCASSTTFNESSYLVTGVVRSPNTQHHLKVWKYNYSDVLLDSVEYYNNPDTVLYGGAMKNTTIVGDKIVVVGNYNFDPSTFPFQNSPTWIQITRIDTNLQIIDHHFYGGDAAYMPYNIISTTDGGALIVGNRYDYLSPTANQYDVFALKVNELGLITELPNQPQAKAHDAILFPNPGSEILNIQSGQQINGAQFTLYDMQGRAMCTETITATALKLTTSTLPSGTYPWQIVFKNKVIESGKWVKE